MLNQRQFSKTSMVFLGGDEAAKRLKQY